MSLSAAQPPHARSGDGQIDPFLATAGGAYVDALVDVRAERGPLSRRSLHMVRTPHFDLTFEGARVRLTHRVPPEEIDDDLSGLLADELFSPGWLRGTEVFQRLFTGIVLTSADDALTSWTLFYANTLRRIEAHLDAADGGEESRADETCIGGHGTITGYAPVYARAEQVLAPGTALELGSCFGFLSLRLAAAGRRVVASDLSSGTVALLRTVAPILGIDLEAWVADATRFPAPERVADNVLAVHLLEHLDPDRGERALAEAIRLARHRVVVAVPLEEVADETWGHVRTVSLADLDAWGVASGLPYQVFEHHGGWLLLETAP